jgi:hypothetical protein
VIEHHDGSLADVWTRRPSVQSAISIEIQGETSVTLRKQSYRFEFLDDKRESRDLPLLGMPSGTDWVLHSCGADRTCLRNALAYRLAREFGRYAPRTRFIELFVNDEYRGIYVLVERVLRDTHRIDLPRPSETAADGDLSGGYVFKIDQGEGRPTDAAPRDWVSPVTQMLYSYHYPRFNRMTAAQKGYLQDHVGRFEAMMQAEGWADAESGYRRWLDVPSWIDFALIQELSLNPDAYSKSVFLQKLPRSMGDTIALGPIWDFDLAFGAAEFRDSRSTDAWAHQMNRFGTAPVRYDPPGQVPFVPAYWERLWTDPAFHQDLRCRWRDLRRGALHLDALNLLIDGWAGQLALAQPRDAARWGNPPANAYADEIRQLKEFLRRRVAWMDAHLPGACA